MSFISLATIPLPSRLFLAVVTTDVVLRWWRWVVGHWTSWRSQADLGFAVGFAVVISGSGLRSGLCQSPSRLTMSLGFAVDSSLNVLLRQEPVLLIWLWWFAVDCSGFAVGLIEWILLWWWVCGFFYSGLRWIYGGLRWWVCICNSFWFFLFFILRCPKHWKIFFRLFSKMQSNTGKKLFSLKWFTFANIYGGK